MDLTAGPKRGSFEPASKDRRQLRPFFFNDTATTGIYTLSLTTLFRSYETLEGWKGTTAGARSWAELPAEAVKYVRRIEELIGTPVAVLSTSPERLDRSEEHTSELQSPM